MHHAYMYVEVPACVWLSGKERVLLWRTQSHQERSWHHLLCRQSKVCQHCCRVGWGRGFPHLADWKGGFNVNAVGFVIICLEFFFHVFSGIFTPNDSIVLSKMMMIDSSSSSSSFIYSRLYLLSPPPPIPSRSFFNAVRTNRLCLVLFSPGQSVSNPGLDIFGARPFNHSFSSDQSTFQSPGSASASAASDVFGRNVFNPSTAVLFSFDIDQQIQWMDR